MLSARRTKRFHFNESQDITKQIDAIRRARGHQCQIDINLACVSSPDIVVLAFAIAYAAVECETAASLEVRYPFTSESEWVDEDEKLAVFFATFTEISFSNVSSLKIKGCIGDAAQRHLGMFLQGCGDQLSRLEYAGNDNFQHLQECPNLAVQELYVNGKNLQLQRRPQINSHSMLLLIPLLASNRLTTLQILRCESSALPILADLLRSQTSLTKLHICILETHLQESTHLIDSLKNLTNLQDLRIDGSTASLSFGTEGNSSTTRTEQRQLLLRHVAQVASTSLPKLHSFSYNPLSFFETFDILELVPIFHTVRKVSLFFVDIERQPIYPKSMWESVFAGNISLEILDVQTLRVSAGETFSKAIVESLPCCATIKSVRLPIRDVSPNLSKAILDAAGQSTSLLQIETASFKGYLGESHEQIKHHLDRNILLVSDFLTKAPLSLYPLAFRSLTKKRNFGTAFILLQEHCGILIQSIQP